MNQSDGEDNFHYNYEHDLYSNNSIDYFGHYKTEIPHEQAQLTIQRFQTLMHSEANTKNIPKTFGNNFKKFMDGVVNQKQEFFRKHNLPEQIHQFLNKKNKGQQSSYILKDFQNLFSNDISSKWFQFYIENCAFLDLIHSNRIENVEEYILFIEQYLAGSRDPDHFISNRQIKNKKENAKMQKIEKKLSQMGQDYDSNLQFLEYNDVSYSVKSIEDSEIPRLYGNIKK